MRAKKAGKLAGAGQRIKGKCAGRPGQAQSPNSEVRRKAETRNPNPILKSDLPHGRRANYFGLRTSFGLRAFGFQAPGLAPLKILLSFCARLRYVVIVGKHLTL